MKSSEIDISIEDLEGAFASASEDRIVRAVQMLRASWPALAAEFGPRIRAILDGLHPDLWHAEPWLVAAYGSSFRSVQSTGRSAAIPYFVAAQSMITDVTASELRIGIGLQYSAALRGLGMLTEALEAASACAAILDADSTLTLADRISLGAQASLHRGLACYHLGDYDTAAAELRRASAPSATSLSRADRVECFSGLAMVHYSFGKLDRTAHYISLAQQASERSGLIDSRFGAGALVAELLISVERGTLADAETLMPSVASATTRSDWEPLGLHSRASVSILSKRYIEGLDLLRQCGQEYSTWTPAGAIALESEALKAYLMLRLGETDSAWDSLSALQPTQHHANCPARLIAHLRLTTGDMQGALTALVGCDALGDGHASRTLIDVLLIAAAASHQLSDFTLSAISFDRAIMLAATNILRSPFRLVPATIVREMIVRARNRPQPPAAADIFDTVNDLPAAGGTTVGVLTSREREIILAITQNLSVSEIAATLFISVNTVKTHVKSIYRKLGVNSRVDATRRAKALGLHGESTQEPPAQPQC